LPISDFANRYEPAGFRDNILYGSGDKINGETFGFQADGDAYLMFYNRKMLDDPQAQYDYSVKFGTTMAWPRTWSELDRQIEFFHRPSQDQFGGLLFRTAGYVAWEWWVRFHAKGSWPFSSEMEPLIANDAGISALQDMILVTDYLKPDVTRLDLFSNWKTYSEGNIYANIGWGGSQKYFQRKSSKIRGKIAFGPTPGGVIDGKLLETPYFNWGWTYVVTASCPVPEIAYLFALFASSPAMSTMSVRQSDGFFDPFRPEHYEDQGILDAYSPEFLNVHRKSLDRSIPDLYLPRQSDYFQTLGEWLYRALNREITPQVALDTVAQRWEAITRSVGKAQQIQNWHNLKLSYPTAVRKILKEVS
jgi:multiple sugar transport system substrate-binding protein